MTTCRMCNSDYAELPLSTNGEILRRTVRIMVAYGKLSKLPDDEWLQTKSDQLKNYKAGNDTVVTMMRIIHQLEELDWWKEMGGVV